MLDRLQEVPVPIPDPARREAAIAAAGMRFANSGSASAPVTWWHGWPRWILPAGAVAAAVALAVLLLPGALVPPGDLPAELSEAPAIPAPNPEPANEGGQLARSPEEGAPGVTFGARPTPPGPAAPPDLLDIAPVPETHRFGPVEILSRDLGEEITLSLVQEGEEILFDRRQPGEEPFEILDAFLLPGPEGGDLLLLRSRLGGAANWDAFVMDQGTIRLSGALSLRIHDLPDRLSVIAALAYR